MGEGEGESGEREGGEDEGWRKGTGKTGRQQYRFPMAQKAGAGGVQGGEQTQQLHETLS